MLKMMDVRKKRRKKKRMMRTMMMKKIKLTPVINVKLKKR